MSQILPKRWLNASPINWEARINSIVSEIHRSANPVPLFLKTARSRSKCQRSGRLAGGTRKVMAFIDRELPRLA